MVRGPIEDDEEASGGARQWPVPLKPLIGLAGAGARRVGANGRELHVFCVLLRALYLGRGNRRETGKSGGF